MSRIHGRASTTADATRAREPSGLGPALEAATVETLGPILVALTAIGALIAVVDWLSRDARTAALLTLVTVGFASALLWARDTLRRTPPDAGKAHGILSGIITLVLALVCVRALLAPGPHQSAGVALVLILSGFFVLSTRWLAAVLAVGSLGWVGVTAASTHELDAPTVILLSSSLALAVAAHALRIQILRREQSWRLAIQKARDDAESALLALREGEERTRSVIEASLDAVISADERGVITDWNGCATAILGWSREEAIGRSAGELIVPPRLREAYERALRDFTATGHDAILNRRVEQEIRHRDGHCFLAEVAVSLARENNRPIFSAFIRDITRRHAMEETMREEARVSASLARVGRELIGSLSTPGLLRRLCELTADVLECDISNTFLLDRESNTYVPVQTHGHSQEEWATIQSLRLSANDSELGSRRLGDETVVAISGEDTDFPFAWLLERFGIRAALLITLRRGTDLIGVQTAAHRGAGAGFTAAQLRLARDLAQIASMALDNARLFEEAERSSRIKSEFVATMSHELRTPLNVILGYHELLLEGMFAALSGEQSEILQRCNRSALQLRELITATLDMSRLEAGRMELDLEEVDLAALARDIDAETQPFRADKPEVELRWQIAGDLARISTDRSKLKVVIKNLVSNAVKFTDRGNVTVFIEPVGTNGAEIRVVDTGIGIPPEAMQAVFEPFRQADGSSTRRHGGVGLGLYIVCRLLEMIGASIDVESEVGKGTTFRIRIEDPWCDAPAAKVPRRLAPAPRPSSPNVASP